MTAASARRGCRSRRRSANRGTPPVPPGAEGRHLPLSPHQESPQGLVRFQPLRGIGRPAGAWADFPGLLTVVQTVGVSRKASRNAMKMGVDVDSTSSIAATNALLAVGGITQCWRRWG
jgi:hypothetical protein